VARRKAITIANFVIDTILFKNFCACQVFAGIVCFVASSFFLLFGKVFLFWWLSSVLAATLERHLPVAISVNPRLSQPILVANGKVACNNIVYLPLLYLSIAWYKNWIINPGSLRFNEDF